MGKIYSSPLRVYLFLGGLALIGIYSGFHLPVSMFPNSSKPSVGVWIPYGPQNATEFLHTYGEILEGQLRGISSDKLQVDKLSANYGPHEVDYMLEFKWGNSPTSALKEVQTVVNSFSARLAPESRNGWGAWANSRSAGFLVVSFYSAQRTVNEVYDIVEPVLMPRIDKLNEVQNPELYNPQQKEVRVELNRDAMAAMQILPRDVENAVTSALGGLTGGNVAVGSREMQIEMPRQVSGPEDLGQISLTSPAGRSLHLSDIAHVELGPSSLDVQSIKTDGAPSVILYLLPKPGGNVKKMAEDVLEMIKEAMPSLPSDLRYRVLVDPSEFIRSSVNNVLHEVAIAALLAVAVLFLFIGSVRNVITAAIEIPLSLVLAFILMRFSGINLNLISLGGLALSAGMNVDASVVVLENIIRHFESHQGKLDLATRLKILTDAVREVQFAVLASTVSSIIVFLPLTFTSDLTYGILGDLAFAVVFSHGFSALVALLLVPTVRLQMMASGKAQGTHSPIEVLLKRLENAYAWLLSGFLARPRLKGFLYLALPALLVTLALLILPRLPREIIGKPDTDLISLRIQTSGNTLLQQMELTVAEAERDLVAEVGPAIQYTIAQFGINEGHINARLKDKSQMVAIKSKLEKRFVNTPTVSFTIDTFNPSELPIPDPPDFQLSVRGGSARDRQWVASELSDRLQATKIYPRVFTAPQGSALDRAILIEPHREQWAALEASTTRLTPSDLADLLRVSTNGRQIGLLPLGGRLAKIVLRYPSLSVGSVEDVGAFPVEIGSKLVPLRALAEVRVEPAPPPIYREDGREVYLINARLDSNVGAAAKAEAAVRAEAEVKKWRSENAGKNNGTSPPVVAVEDPAKDLTEAIHQLGIAVGLSCVLIFLTLLLQFGSLPEALLVLISVPAGFIGVLISLYVFGSTLSLNSILGVILLNGIAVANSILLVDFIKRRVAAGLSPAEAAVDAARKRLRPILITSMTTMLGMLPIALGAGEGGRILQPLGIAVAGGLWVSMALTLFIVPSLQVGYLQWREKPPRRRKSFSPALAIWLALIFAGVLWPMQLWADEDRTLSFEEAMQTILSRSTDVGTQRETLEQTRAQNIPDHLALLPKLSLNVGETENTSLGIQETQKGGGAVLDVNLFRFGADAAAMRAANAEERAQVEKLQDQRLKTEEDAVNALVDYLQSRKQWDALKRQMTFQESLHDIAEERYRRGLESEESVDTVGVDQANLEAQLHDAELTGLDAQRALQRLLGHTRVEAEWPWREKLTIPLSALTKGKLDLSARSDWKSAKEKVEGSRERMKQKFGKMLPSLDAEVSYGYYQYSYNSSLIADPPPGVQVAGFVNLTIPLFDRLSGYSDYQAQAHQLAIAEMVLEDVKRSAESDWGATRDGTLIALKESASREKTLATSRRLYQTNLARYRRGLLTANDLNLDQQRSFNAESNAIVGWANVHKKFAHLCHTLGLELAGCLMRR